MSVLVHGQDPTITGIVADLTTIEGKIDTVDGIVDNIQLDTNSIETKVDALAFEVSTLTSAVSGIGLEVDMIYLNQDQVIQVSLDQEANVGDIVLATVTGSCLIESIVVKTITTHGDLTSIAVTGGASGVVEFISAASGAAANLDAADKQVSWSGAVELGNAKTIVITFAGTGSTHVTMNATIKYRPCTLNGALT